MLVPANTGNFVFMVRKDLPCPEAPAGGAAPKNGDSESGVPTFEQRRNLAGPARMLR